MCVPYTMSQHAARPPPEGLTGGALAAVIAAPIAACCLVVVAVGLVYFLRLRKKGVKSEMRVADV